MHGPFAVGYSANASCLLRYVLRVANTPIAFVIDEADQEEVHAYSEVGEGR